MLFTQHWGGWSWSNGVLGALGPWSHRQAAIFRLTLCCLLTYKKGTEAVLPSLVGADKAFWGPTLLLLLTPLPPPRSHRRRAFPCFPFVSRSQERQERGVYIVRDEKFGDLEQKRDLCGVGVGDSMTGKQAGVCGLPSSCFSNHQWLPSLTIISAGSPALTSYQPGLCSSPQGLCLWFSGTTFTSRAGRTGAASPSKRPFTKTAALSSATKR